MKGSLTQISAPATGLVTLADAKDHLRVTASGEDVLISGIIASVSAYLDAKDGVLGEAFITQTWRYTMDAAPTGSLILPLGPVLSVSAVKYVTTAGAEATFSAANYRLAGNVLELVPGASWPATDSREAAFWVEYVAGYGDTAAIPQTVAHLAKVMIFEAYEQRGMASDRPRNGEMLAAMLLSAARTERGLF